MTHNMQRHHKATATSWELVDEYWPIHIVEMSEVRHNAQVCQRDLGGVGSNQVYPDHFILASFYLIKFNLNKRNN